MESRGIPWIWSIPSKTCEYSCRAVQKSIVYTVYVYIPSMSYILQWAEYIRLGHLPPAGHSRQWPSLSGSGLNYQTPRRATWRWRNYLHDLEILQMQAVGYHLGWLLPWFGSYMYGHSMFKLENHQKSKENHVFCFSVSHQQHSKLQAWKHKVIFSRLPSRCEKNTLTISFEKPWILIDSSYPLDSKKLQFPGHWPLPSSTLRSEW